MMILRCDVTYTCGPFLLREPVSLRRQRPGRVIPLSKFLVSLFREGWIFRTHSRQHLWRCALP